MCSPGKNTAVGAYALLRGLPDPGIGTLVSYVFCIGSGSLPPAPPGNSGYQARRGQVSEPQIALPT